MTTMKKKKDGFNSQEHLLHLRNNPDLLEYSLQTDFSPFRLKKKKVKKENSLQTPYSSYLNGLKHPHLVSTPCREILGQEFTCLHSQSLQTHSRSAQQHQIDLL